MRDELPVRVDDLGDNHLERPFHVGPSLGGDLNVVAQVQEIEDAPGPRRRDASLLQEVGLGASE